ncbi:MAG: cobalt-precorrin-5B (C(1))-methyltransferase CbiD [Dethiobacteria bacterium]
MSLIDLNSSEQWRYTVTGGKKMRRGFTTGSCAAAAAKAATLMLFGGQSLDQVELQTPAGVNLNLQVFKVELGENYVCCAVRKDAGDDPDITNGILIYARAEKSEKPGICLLAGSGIGRVTKPGLQVPVGRPAINPVPEKMIFEAIKAGLPDDCGVTVELSIPDGERLARKTMNSRLGIVGGLSILGTSGLVEPMSEQAYEKTLALEFKALRAEYEGPVVMVTGNFGRTLALEHFKLPGKAVIKIGNLVGYGLDRCREQDFKKVLLIGHMGKLIKVAAGIFNTHSRVADARFETFAARAALLGAKQDTIICLQEAVTTEDMVDILGELGGAGYFDQLAGEISSRAMAYLFEEVEIGTVLFNFRRGLLGMDGKAEMILEEF